MVLSYEKATYETIQEQFRLLSSQIQEKKHFTHIKVVEFFGDKNGNNLDDIDSLVEHGLSIDHIDRNKRNNAYTNLEIVTHQENCIRKYN